MEKTLLSILGGALVFGYSLFVGNLAVNIPVDVRKENAEGKFGYSEARMKHMKTSAEYGGYAAIIGAVLGPIITVTGRKREYKS